jgi:sugar-specific transcriptional regulator TrmB
VFKINIENYKDLKELGLTIAEIKVYVTLLKLNESKTGTLCSFTKIPSSRIYLVLNLLIKKGLVSYKVENKIKVYMPAPLEILESILKDKQEKIISVIKELKKKEIKTSKFQYKIFNNLRGIKSMFYEINNIMNKDTELNTYCSKKGSFERLIGIFNEHHKLRISQKITANLLLPTEKKELGKKRNNKYTNIKYNNLNNLSEWGTIGDNLFYIFYIKDNDPKGILIEDEIITKTFKEVFKKIWKISK